MICAICLLLLRIFRSAIQPIQPVSGLDLFLSSFLDCSVMECRTCKTKQCLPYWLLSITLFSCVNDASNQERVLETADVLVMLPLSPVKPACRDPFMVIR